MTTQQLGDWLAVTINQAIRDCQIVEVLPDYALAIYTMPAGRAFLTRLPHKVDDTRRPFDNASKKERDRHSVALLKAEILATSEVANNRGRKAGDARYRLQRVKADLAKLTTTPPEPT